MGDYTSDRETALELLEDAGGPLVLVRTVEGPYDPGTGGSVDTTQNLNVTGVTIPVKVGAANGTTVQVGDLRLICQGDELAVGDTLNGYQVAWINTLDPDGSGLIIQTCILRE